MCVRAQGLLKHFSLPTFVLTGAQGLLKHFSLPTFALTGAQGLLNHPVCFVCVYHA
jgi:hypothetical protein